MDLKNSILSQSDRCPEGISRLKQENNLFIWGTDYTDKIMSEIRGSSGIKITGIILPESLKSRTEQEEIVSEEDVRKRYKLINIIVGFSWSKNPQLLQSLCDDDFIRHIYIMEGAEYAWYLMFNPEMGLFKHEKLIFVDSYYKGLLKRGLDYDYYKLHKEEFLETYHIFDDELSKDTMVQYIDGHVNLRTFPMEKVKDISPQYFCKELIKLKDGEVFVDCGAYDGDTVVRFHEMAGENYGHIYALEPDQKMYEHLQNNIKGIERCEVLQKGAYNQDMAIGFSNKNCGTISNDDIDHYIHVDRLDNLIMEKVTFIKMDIEGAELAALEGAEEIIKRDRPKLAICVYHKAEDLITIPQYIKKLVPEYKLYLRAYFDYCSEVVLYAVV